MIDPSRNMIVKTLVTTLLLRNFHSLISQSQIRIFFPYDILLHSSFHHIFYFETKTIYGIVCTDKINANSTAL